ncbi:MAG: ribonuclease III [Clostridiales bacterium]|nr:ribonuclease III [Clostridiales bacterium]
MSENLKILQEKLQYNFKNENLLIQALTHSSYANEKQNPKSCNERLEFLGDSVLGFITAEYFYRSINRPEGELTKIRAATVCEQSLFNFAQQIELGEFLLLGKGEIHTGGRERPSILADAFEAVIAAIFLDGGIEQAKAFVMRFVQDAAHVKPSFNDYKTTLQEVIQKNKEEKLEYVLINESGPDHDKHFIVEVHLNSNVIGRGEGRSKKIAEQEAAHEALSLMGL